MSLGSLVFVVLTVSDLQVFAEISQNFPEPVNNSVNRGLAYLRRVRSIVWEFCPQCCIAIGSLWHRGTFHLAWEHRNVYSTALFEELSYSAKDWNRDYYCSCSHDEGSVALKDSCSTLNQGYCVFSGQKSLFALSPHHCALWLAGLPCHLACLQGLDTCLWDVPPPEVFLTKELSLRWF